MKTNHTATLLAAIAVEVALAGPALAGLDTLEEWGNAAGTTPPASFTVNAGTIAITGGGQDFWGTSDAGVFLWDSSGANTTTGDFTATARHVSTTTPAPEWGRDGIMVRATQSTGTLSPNDAHWLAHRKSNGQFISGRRPTPGDNTYRATDIGNAAVNYSSDDNDQAVQTGNVTNTPNFIAAARQGDRLYSGFALDLGGVPGRWVQHWSTDNATAISSLQAGAEVIVGLAHQSHPQTISPDSGDINTATFDTWTYQGSFDASKFGPASSASTWQIGGTATVNAATGAVTGAAYVRQANVATGEKVKWTLLIDRTSSLYPVYGLAGSRKDTKAMEVADLVPPANFRQGGEGSAAGLLADIYLNANQGTSATNLAFIANNPPSGTAVVPRIHWSNPGTVGYPTNGTGGNRFADAVPGSFGPGVNQENFGVDHHGQIFIPGDATRTSLASLGVPAEMIIFKDGVDDFCYLEIDGIVLINDNDWTGNTSVDNGGGNVSALDVSNPKYDDGEWVDFRMVSWEGGGGDTASLYWNAADPNRTFGVPQVPGVIGTFTAITGLAGSKQDPVAMEVADLVPPANFRHDNAGTFQPGLKADIYLHGNDGNFATLDDYVTNNPPSGTAILPTIHWSNNPDPPYPPNDPPDASNRFEVAVPGSFASGSNQENYGVNLTGQIFIPGDAARTALNAQNGNNLIAFEDGVDDFCYLEIDGVPLINDNNWTGNTSVDNGGGNIALLDVSAPKFDDGEWVSFRMMTWEGGGGDTASLYWSALDKNGSFQRTQLPGTTAPPEIAYTGNTQVGTHNTNASFGPPVPPGQWIVRYQVANSGVSTNTFAVVTVAGSAVPAPQITSYTYNPATNVLNLTFTSQAGTNYALEYTTGFQPAGAPTSAQKWNTVPGYASIPGAATTTSITPLNTSVLVTPGGQLPDNSQSHFRIRRL